MSAFFIDLDGTLLRHGSNDLLPGTREFLQGLSKDHQIILTTRRGLEFEGHPVYAKEPTEVFLKNLEEELGIKFLYVLYGVSSPRIVINDDGCEAIQCKTNEGCENLCERLI